MKNKKEIWFIPEEFGDAYIALMASLPEAFIDIFPKAGAGKYFTKSFSYFENFYIKFGFVRKEFDKASEFVARKMFDDPDWAFNIHEIIVLDAKKSWREAINITENKLKNLSDAKLIALYKNFWNHHKLQHSLGVITTWIADAHNEHFSNKVKDLLVEKIKKYGLGYDLASVFSLLTTPTKKTFFDEEEKEILNLTKKINNKPKIKNIILNSKDFGEIDNQIRKIDIKTWWDIERLYRNYCWIIYVYMGPANTKNYYYSVIKGLLQQKINFSNLINNIDNKKIEIGLGQKEMIKEFKLEKKERKIIKLANDIVWLKPYRKENLSLIAYTYEKIFKELGRRYGLSVNQIRMCFPREINNKFLSSNNVANILNQRIKKCFWYYGKDKKVFAVGKKAEEFISKIKFEHKKIPNINEIFGSCAFGGKAKGVVKIVITPQDMVKMNKGDILVSRSTNPNIVSAMKKAAAIITNTGGLTCHAAIVSRELKIPCVVGTKIATEVLKDGDIVKVDANNGTIKKI